MATLPKKTMPRSGASSRAPRSGTGTQIKSRTGVAKTATGKGASPRPSSFATAEMAGKASMDAATDETVIASATPAPAPTLTVDADATKILSRQELFERVIVASGAKKKDVKPIAEAVLAVIGSALSNDEELNLPPLGKMRVIKHREQGAGEIVTLKLRRKSEKRETAADPLAEGDD